MNDLNKAIELNYRDPIFYFNRGNVFYQKKEFEKAHNDYDRAIEIEPNNPWFWHSKGLAFECVEDSKENISEAIKMFK